MNNESNNQNTTPRTDAVVRAHCEDGPFRSDHHIALADFARRLERDIQIQQRNPAMPGAWICDKCHFIQQKNILHAASGNVSADTSPLNNICPNDGQLMRPFTWREANDGYDKENSRLRGEVGKLRAVLEESEDTVENLKEALGSLLADCKKSGNWSSLDHSILTLEKAENVFSAIEARTKGTENRPLYSTLANGMKLYQVKLVGGPGDGQASLCSHDTVYWNSHLYLRGLDDLYYFTKPEELNGQGAGAN